MEFPQLEQQQQKPPRWFSSDREDVTQQKRQRSGSTSRSRSRSKSRASAQQQPNNSSIPAEAPGKPNLKKTSSSSGEKSSTHAGKGEEEVAAADLTTEDQRANQLNKGLSPAGCSIWTFAAVPPNPSPVAHLPVSGNSEEHSELYGIEGRRGIEVRSADTMAKKRAEENHGPPEARRAKRQAPSDARATSASNGALAAKRPRGRPPNCVSAEPLAPKPIATTAARKSRKAAEATQPESENPSASQAVATRAPRASRRKRPRISFPSSTNDMANEALKCRSAKRNVSVGRSRHSSRRRHSGCARKARSR
ncbi:serine/arginine-rich splicing factor 4-like [Rhipicephalus sanguineus]|uniref:serine/arginine-rich splicing factor 4-like n=1 Tax=Rhipicephalus sanguineus TaxID=34632 RepID=UPI0020C2237A|nr:serine/arginine-rich splicing factor 4-like [Rhipicephalus sanguineus]